MHTRIISFHSVRRGSGKSTLVANLAGLLVSQGRRVVIVESDFHSPSLHLFLKLPDWIISHTLNDYLAGECAIDQATYEVTLNLGAKVPGKLFLVPASQNLGDALSMKASTEKPLPGYTFEHLHQGFQKIIEIFQPDAIFVDNMAGLNEEALLSVASSSSLVLILQADQQDFQGTAVAIEVAQKLKDPEVYLVLNNVPESIDPDKARQQLEQVYQRKVIAILPQSMEIATLASNGLLVFEKARAPILEDFQQILTYLFPV
jgi:septum site-determining protein MinD